MRIPRRWAFAVAALAAWPAFTQTAAIDPHAYLKDIQYLASPELKGRATGTPELELAARFLEGKYRAAGIQPPPGNDYLQAFQVTMDGTLGPANRFQFTDRGHPTTLRPGGDFVPMGFSSAGKVEGAVVFAGYGITAPEYHYDDYAGMDVKGKLVLILRHEPQEFDEHSVFAGKEFTSHATFASKASNAKMHGAAGVILVSDRANHAGEPDELAKFGEVEGPSDAGIPFVQVKEERVNPWFADAGRSLPLIESGIDKDLKPESFAFPDSIRVDANVDIQRPRKTTHNVAAYLPGETAEYVIVGAHYDHLGMGGQFSLTPGVRAVHPGADDNASGTAGVVELAQWFARQPKRKRGILFLDFAGEEIGLLGSEWYASHPELPLENAVAMINMDMIGRVRGGKLYVGGLDTGSTLRAMLDRIAPRYQTLKIDYSNNSGYGSSDHTSFTAKGVPVLFFFSGLHADYHKPGDTWEKIDAPAAVEVLALVSDCLAALGDAPDRPRFVKVAPPAHGTGPVSTSGGYGPYFGSIPDFGEGTKGVKFADIRDGSPAAKAGFKGGDVLVEFDGKPIQNLYDFTYALQAKKPGDEVMVKVLRDGSAIEAKVLLTQRP